MAFHVRGLEKKEEEKTEIKAKENKEEKERRVTAGGHASSILPSEVRLFIY